MDPKIGWFQPEQEGPSKDNWIRIWENLQRNPTHTNSKSVDRKSHEQSVSQQQTKEHLEGDPANVWNNNWASTFSMNKHKDNLIGTFGGCPWRPPNKLYDARPIVA